MGLWPRGLEADSDWQWKVWSNADHVPLSLEMPLSVDQVRRIGERKLAWRSWEARRQLRVHDQPVDSCPWQVCSAAYSGRNAAELPVRAVFRSYLGEALKGRI